MYLIFILFIFVTYFLLDIQKIPYLSISEYRSLDIIDS